MAHMTMSNFAENLKKKSGLCNLMLRDYCIIESWHPTDAVLG